MKVHALRCLTCNTTVYSRTTHDRRHCLCQNIAIDGGFDYIKISWVDKNTFVQYPEYEIGEVTKEELYNDWNKRINKYGFIKNVTKPKQEKI